MLKNVLIRINFRSITLNRWLILVFQSDYNRHDRTRQIKTIFMNINCIVKLKVSLRNTRFPVLKCLNFQFDFSCNTVVFLYVKRFDFQIWCKQIEAYMEEYHIYYLNLITVIEFWPVGLLIYNGMSFCVETIVY